MPARIRRLVVASGPTREWLDPVRFITNPSSGQTGWELARFGLAHADIGEVILISGPGLDRFRTLENAQNVEVDTTAEMATVVRASLCDNCLLFMAAAPADFTPSKPSELKIKKEQMDRMQIELSRTEDILKSLIPIATELENLHRVGFAAETDHMEEHALKKLNQKNLDFICANHVYKITHGFGSHENTLLVLGKHGSRKILGPSPKSDLAQTLLNYIILNI